MFFSIFSSFGTNAQYPTSKFPDANYISKIGDKNTYDVVKADTLNSESSSKEITLNNGTPLYYKKTKGVKFTFTVILFVSEFYLGTQGYVSRELTIE